MALKPSPWYNFHEEKNMKILFYRQNLSIEQDIIQQFSDLGLLVKSIDGHKDKETAINELSVLIDNKETAVPYSFVFSVNFFPEISDLCRNHEVSYVCWCTDAPQSSLFSTQVKNPCNRLFLFDKKLVEDVSKYNEGNVYHLPLCTNPDTCHKTVKSITHSDYVKYAADISFIGSLSGNNDPLSSLELSQYSLGYLEGLINVQKDIQGFNIFEKSLTNRVISELKEKLPERFVNNASYVKNMDSYISAHDIVDPHCDILQKELILSRLSEQFSLDIYSENASVDLISHPNLRIHEFSSYQDETPKIYKLSKINLNISPRSIETGIPSNVWDIMASGGFLLTNFQEEFSDYFVPGVEYDFYTDADDLMEKCRYYLSNDYVREYIAENGAEAVRRYHNYSDRMSKLFKAII